MSLPYGFGYQTVDAVDIFVDGDASESYLDWRVGISKECWDSGWTSAIGMPRTRRSFADSGRRIAGARRGDDIRRF